MRRTSAHRGIALVLVLWVLTLLTVMAVGMTAAQRTETALTENQIADARFRALTDAALVYAMFDFMAPPQVVAEPLSGADETQTAAWLPNGVPRPWTFDGTDLTIAVYNERSRINLNLAPAPALSALLATLGEDDETAAAIADAIVDWRDEDDLKSLNGAEDAEYKDAGRVVGAKDAPFVAVEELQQVLGVNHEIYLRLAPEVTVEPGTDQVDQTFASAAVLAALQGIALADAQLQVQERDNPAQGPVAVNRGGPLYRIQVKEQGAGATARAMEALVEVTPGQSPPYQVRWRRFGLVTAPPVATADGG
jgi:general secretion pathway protein K